MKLIAGMKVLYTQPSPNEIITVTVKKVSKKIVGVNRNVIDENFVKQLKANIILDVHMSILSIILKSCIISII